MEVAGKVVPEGKIWGVEPQTGLGWGAAEQRWDGRAGCHGPQSCHFAPPNPPICNEHPLLQGSDPHLLLSGNNMIHESPP